MEIDISRYISLDDGVGIDDIALALERALQTDYKHLLESGFNVIIHSTGALVIRNCCVCRINLSSFCTAHRSQRKTWGRTASFNSASRVRERESW